MNKDFFQFKWFNELQVGDVFKFCPVIDSEIPNKFFTAFFKDDKNTKFNATYGKELNTTEFSNETKKEIMIFPNRKR
jgi:hypothetical protein